MLYFCSPARNRAAISRIKKMMAFQQDKKVRRFLMLLHTHILTIVELYLQKETPVFNQYLRGYAVNIGA
jgi:hypothetical protein